MKNILMVAEKPSLAQSIAKILSRGNFSSRKSISGPCLVHEYEGEFYGEKCLFKVTSVCGHVMSLDFDARFNNWEKVDPAELFAASTIKKEANPKLNIIKFLEKEAKRVDVIVLWLDCDKEGENICYEVLDIVTPVMNQDATKKNIFRAKFSAITDKDIHEAMNNLGEPNYNESLCVDSRQELDLRLGCAFTRFQTRFFQGRYGNLDSSLISYGPCQTPTLGFCVNRHDKIKSFVPEKYWIVHTEVKVPSTDLVVKLDWTRVRTFDQEIAQMCLNLIKSSETAIVQGLSNKKKHKVRPQALNTVEMLRIASSSLNLGPQQAMQIAERLYTQGYISYPRTETTQYPKNFDFKSTLMNHKSNKMWGYYVQNLLQTGFKDPRKGVDIGDHPPITPMRSAGEDDFDQGGWKLYSYITKHFLATLSPDCTYLRTEVSFAVGSETFLYTANSPLKPGYTEIMPWQSFDGNQIIPNFQVGDTCSVDKVELQEKLTAPPDYLTESEVITLMEKHGIGTDASIPTHINNICQRNYVYIGSGRRLIPTPLGIVLVHGYRKIDPDLVLPTMRAAVEEQLYLIATGKAQYAEVLEHAIDAFRQKFHYFVDQIANMDQLFEVSFSPLSETGKPLSRCGKCHRFMKYISVAPARLHCSTCDDTYSLPTKTNVKLYKELRCPLDDFELVVCSTGCQGKSYTLCPYCYNHPPFHDMKKGLGCNACTHPACSHAMLSLGVVACSECEAGVLVLDPASGPKWKLCCNNTRCASVVTLFKDAYKVSVSDRKCSKCGSFKLNVKFRKDTSPLETKGGCIFCDDGLSSLFQLRKARTVLKQIPSDRGRGTGRGKPRPPKDRMSKLAAYFV